MGRKLSFEETIAKKIKVAAALFSNEGRKVLAADFTRLFKQYRDYVGLARKFLRVDPLGQGVPAIYDTDPAFSAVSLDKDGETPLPVVNASRFSIDTFTISCPVQFTLAEAREMRYHLPDRIRDKGKIEVVKEEDRRIFAAIDAASIDLGTYVPGSLVPSMNQTSPEAMNYAMGQIEKYNLHPENSVWNPQAITWMRSLGREWLTPNSQDDMNKTGYLGSWLGVKIFRSILVPTSTAGDGTTVANGYVMCEPEYLGRIPLRQDITVVPMDSPQRLTIGYNIFELLGIGVQNSYGVVKIGYKAYSFTE